MERPHVTNFIRLFVGITLMTFCADLSVLAQARQLKRCTFEIDSIFKKVVYTSVDVMPEFQNGMGSILKYFKFRFRVPEDIAYFQASFTTIFVIDSNGILKAARIKGKCESQLTELERQVLNIYRNMPRWKAGKCRGKNVPVIMTLNFKL